MTEQPCRTLDWAEYKRRGHFEYFSSFGNPYVSVTANRDITLLRRHAKEAGRPFFLTALYALGRAANSVPEFRQRVKDGRIVEFDDCPSSYTVALPDGTYCYCEADTRLPYERFILEAQKKQDDAVHNPSIEESDPLPLFFVSSLPWLSFTSLALPTPTPADYNPRLTLGRFFAENGKTLLPVSVCVNHALIDGKQIADFYDAFDRETAALAGLIAQGAS